MLDQQTKKRIDDCRDILVGKITDPKSQVEQITIALIFKFMDDMDTEAIEMGGVPTYFVGDYERYSWKNIFSPRIGGDEMLSLYGEGMVKMNQNPNLPQLFRDIFKNAYLPYRDPETLKLFLKTINEFKYDHSERLGDAFEYLLSVLGSQGDAGQFRTPRHIIDFIVKIIDPKKNETMLDPSSGTCGFLISGYKHILSSNTKNTPGDLLTPDERKKLMNNVTGYDISPDMVRLSLVNLFLHGFSNPKVFEYDTLTSEEKWDEYFDCVLANPPFMSPKGGIRPHKRFGIQSNRAEVLFVDYIMEHLTPKGRAGIVVPEGIIFQSGTAYKSLRKTMVEKYLVGVISLPNGVFQPYSGVKTSILVLDKELTQKTDKIFFGKVENDGYDLGAQRREIEKNDLPILVKEVTEYLGGLRNGKDVESEKLNFVSKEQILSSNDIGLSYDRYVESKIRNYNWELLKLKDLTYSMSQGLNTAGEKIEFEESGIQIIQTRNITKGNLDFDNMKYVSISDYNKYRDKHQPLFGDILLSNIGTIGKSIVVDEYSSKIDFLIHWNIFKISPKKDLILPLYLKLCLDKLDRDDYYKKFQTGGTLSFITKKVLVDIEIPLPPIEVQEEIVSELEQYQKIIDGAKQVVDNYKPVIEIDPSWEMKELGEVCLLKQGLQVDTELQSLEPNQGFVPFLRIINYTQPGSELRYIQPPSTNYFVESDDIVMVRYGDAGFVGRGYRGVIANNLFSINPIISNLTKDFLFYILKSTSYNNILKSKIQSSGLPAINHKSVKEIQIPVPPIEIQQTIVEQIENERQFIEGNKKLIEIYTQKIQDRINKIWGE
jgi:type I restriction enzyme M protein